MKAKSFKAVILGACFAFAVSTPSTAQNIVAVGVEKPSLFKDLINDAVAQHPRVNAAISSHREAKQARRETRARYLPTIGLDVAGDATISRNFEERFDNIVERSRDRARADVVLRGQQLLYDGGRTKANLDSASAGVEAREGDVETVAAEVALDAIAAYLNVIRSRKNLELAFEFEQRHQDILAQVQTRYDEGVGALRDVARLRARIADAAAIRANIERNLVNAESRYFELFKERPGADLTPPDIVVTEATQPDDAVQLAYKNNPTLKAFSAQTDIGRHDLEAAKSEYLPNVTLSVDATKFEIFDGTSDYDVRGRLGVDFTIFSGGARSARRNQALHRFRRSEFEEQLAQQELARDINIAFRELEILESQIEVLKRAKKANGDARDLYIEQFKIARGSLLDLLQAEADHFNATIAYTDGLWERDISRYRILNLTGEMLQKLNISLPISNPAELWRR